MGRPVPTRGQEYEIVFPLKDSSGEPVLNATGLDSEISQDHGAFADCTNEAAHFGNGWYYLTLTAAEMTADAIAVVIKSSDALQQDLALYPSNGTDISVHVASIVDGAIAAATFAMNALDAVWNRLTSAITTSGSIGKLIVDKLALLGVASGVTVPSVDVAVGRKRTTAGDSYDGVSHDKIRFSDPTPSTWANEAEPDSITLYILTGGFTEVLTLVALEADIHWDASPRYVDFPLASTQTALMDVTTSNYYQYQLVAVRDLSPDSIETLEVGTWTSDRKQW